MSYDFLTFEEAAVLLGTSVGRIETLILTEEIRGYLYVPRTLCVSANEIERLDHSPFLKIEFLGKPTSGRGVNLGQDSFPYGHGFSNDFRYAIKGWVGVNTEDFAKLNIGELPTFYGTWFWIVGESESLPVRTIDPRVISTDAGPKLKRDAFRLLQIEVEGLKVNPETAPEDNISGRKRNNLLRVIAAFANHVSIDLKEGGGGTAQVLSLLESAGFDSPKEKTVREILSEVRGLSRPR